MSTTCRRFQDVVRDPYIFITVRFMVGSTQILPPTPTDIFLLQKFYRHFQILTAVLRCTYKVILKSVRVTIVTVEKQSVLPYSASVVSYPTSNAHAPYYPISSSVACAALPYFSTLPHKWLHFFNHLTPNGHYMGRTAQLTCRCCILYIYSTNIRTDFDVILTCIVVNMWK